MRGDTAGRKWSEKRTGILAIAEDSFAKSSLPPRNSRAARGQGDIVHSPRVAAIIELVPFALAPGMDRGPNNGREGMTE